jgi:8-oxo-dGTP diphosphatase
MQFDFLALDEPRPRAAAAILRNGGREILMVQHSRKDGSTYWQLPGGGLYPNERVEDGVLRELLEEMGLQGRVVRWLFSIPYKHGSSSTFLVAIDERSEAQLGIDPEESERGYRKLLNVAWRSVSEAQESAEVQVLRIVLSYS